MSESTAQWADIAVESLPVEAQVAYSEYKVAQRKAAELREAFEQSVTASLELPKGKRMVFGYRFGKLSAAIVDDDRKPSKTKQAKGSLADFMAQQLGNGHAA
jgi:hypothetical protein